MEYTVYPTTIVGYPTEIPGYDPDNPEFTVQMLPLVLQDVAAILAALGTGALDTEDHVRLLVGTDAAIKILTPAIDRWRTLLAAQLQPDDTVVYGNATIKRMKDGKKIGWNPALLMAHAATANNLLGSVIGRAVELVPTIKDPKALQEMLDTLTANPDLDPDGTMRGILNAARTETPEKGGLRITRK